MSKPQPVYPLFLFLFRDDLNILLHHFVHTASISFYHPGSWRGDDACPLRSSLGCARWFSSRPELCESDRAN